MPSKVNPSVMHVHLNHSPSRVTLSCLELGSHNYEILMSNKNAKECYMILKEKIATATEHHISSNRIRPTNNPPWFSQVIKRLINARQHSYTKQTIPNRTPSTRTYPRLQEAHGIRGNYSRWIRNWLTGRTQSVVIHDHTSDSTLVTSGVLQGSVLGPLLFIIYINDLDVGIISKINKFADEAKLCHRSFTERDRVTIQSDLNRLLKRTETWQMHFNIDKCSVKHVGANNTHFQHMMYDIPIETVQQQRDLSVIVTENLKHDKQVQRWPLLNWDNEVGNRHVGKNVNNEVGGRRGDKNGDNDDLGTKKSLKGMELKRCCLYYESSIKYFPENYEGEPALCSILLHPDGGQVSVVQVEGVVGESVSLPCHISPPRGDRVAVILWYREHHPDALYTYDARSPGRQQHSSRAPGLKASFHADPPARLVLPRATTKLAGEYECRVDYLHAPSATTKVRLSVVELPASLELKTQDSRPAPPQLDVNMGDSLDLQCKVVGGFPTPRVWWTLGDQILPASMSEATTTSFPQLSQEYFNPRAVLANDTLHPDNYDMYYVDGGPPTAKNLVSRGAENVVVAPLTISKVQREHHGMSVSCHASNTNLTSVAIHAGTKLLVNTPPSSVVISGVPSSIAAGERLRAWCSAPQARPSPVLVWALAKRGKPAKILARQELSERNVSRSWLDVEAEWQDDGASLSCTAHSPAVPVLQVSNSTTLSVTYYQERNDFARAFLDLANDETFTSHLIMSDEAHFHISRYVNKQNYQICYPTEVKACGGRLPIVEVLINKKPAMALVDTGCTMTVVHSKYIAQYDGDASISAFDGRKVEYKVANRVKIVVKGGMPVVTKCGVGPAGGRRGRSTWD
ncbi:Reverse transcriptase domain [Trinorchestia longiramus]|nr:Reverse transcriptase domain [Trinorchestia longiramus]